MLNANWETNKPMPMYRLSKVLLLLLFCKYLIKDKIWIETLVKFHASFSSFTIFYIHVTKLMTELQFHAFPFSMPFEKPSIERLKRDDKSRKNLPKTREPKKLKTSLHKF